MEHSLRVFPRFPRNPGRAGIIWGQGWLVWCGVDDRSSETKAFLRHWIISIVVNQ